MGIRLATRLALVALLLRVLIPAGWMPSDGASGAAFLVFCTGEGPVERLVDSRGEPVGEQHQPPSKDARHAPCAFAALGTFRAPDNVQILQHVAPASRVPWRRQKVRTPARTHLRLAPARAPPIAA